MPGRGKAGGQGRGKGHGGGDPTGAGPMDQVRPDGPGRSEWAPGHLKRDSGERSARDFAPGHGGEPPGRRGGERDDDQDEGETLT